VRHPLVITVEQGIAANRGGGEIAHAAQVTARLGAGRLAPGWRGRADCDEQLRFRYN
jgi:hypothetical protein